MKPTAAMRRLGVVDKYPTNAGGVAARGQGWLVHTLDANNLFELLRKRARTQDQLKTNSRPPIDRDQTDSRPIPFSDYFFERSP